MAVPEIEIDHKITFVIPGRLHGQLRPGHAVVTLGNGDHHVREYQRYEVVSDRQTIAACYLSHASGTPSWDDPVRLWVVVSRLLPKGAPQWLQQRVAAGGAAYCTGHPDASNLLKLVEDALNKIAWKDDSQIVDARCTKRYGVLEQTMVSIEFIRGLKRPTKAADGTAPKRLARRREQLAWRTQRGDADAETVADALKQPGAHPQPEDDQDVPF